MTLLMHCWLTWVRRQEYNMEKYAWACVWVRHGSRRPADRQ